MQHKFEIELRRPAGQEVCDFCSFASIQKAYDCPDFLTGSRRPQTIGESTFTLNSASRGAWAACEICAGLIDNDKWPELAERTLKTLLAKEPGLRPFAAELRLNFVRMHQQFRKLKKLPN